MTTLITGATGGLGRELAMLCAAHNEDLLVTARDADRLTALKAELERGFHVQVMACTIDLGRPDAAQDLYRFAQEKGLQVDTLINNAGFGHYGTFLDTDEGTIQTMIGVNMTAVAMLCRLFGRDMRAHHRGRILNIASVASVMAGPYMAMYYATKAFVSSLGQALAVEMRGTGVTVTTVCPGPIATGFEQAAHMAGKNFFTMAKPSSPETAARFAYARMQAGKALAYQGAMARMVAQGVRFVPRMVAARLAADANGGRP
ncbi:SDR family NAD(P)-dependent oxidoreductase [Bifidobacterium cuniculi]|uniref:Short-chain dehydrogenase/reductase SDR n=1 Tax=Bifidobacterium cuniculi TaxID=1688 RepID=A0A087B429_9BIFI|nr:SDR family oxidoreductase [Bifidobacterium cuniculi]KFI65779.1 short-chain dehydrogenase/reductase SDR [Bifidobacterium cuniculi]